MLNFNNKLIHVLLQLYVSQIKLYFPQINLCLLKSVICLQIYFANGGKIHIFCKNVNSRYLTKFGCLNSLELCNFLVGFNFFF